MFENYAEDIYRLEGMVCNLNSAFLLYQKGKLPKEYITYHNDDFNSYGEYSYAINEMRDLFNVVGIEINNLDLLEDAKDDGIDEDELDDLVESIVDCTDTMLYLRSDFVLLEITEPSILKCVELTKHKKYVTEELHHIFVKHNETGDFVNSFVEQLEEKKESTTEKIFDYLSCTINQIDILEYGTQSIDIYIGISDLERVYFSLDIFIKLINYCEEALKEED